MPTYHHWRVVRPADGAVFTYESYTDRDRAAMFVHYESFERLPDGSLIPLRDYWTLHRGYFMDGEHRRWHLQWLEPLVGQLIQTSVRPRDMWQRILEIQVVHAEYLGKF